MGQQQIRVAIDVGSQSHYVAVSDSEGSVLEEFEIGHTQEGFRDFFHRVGAHERRLNQPVVVAMEGYNGWARPLDTRIRRHGWRLFNVNNLKLARYKEIFPGPAKSEPLDTAKMLELFHLRESLPMAKAVLQEIKPTPAENQRLKRLTRRRRQMVDEKVRLVERMHADLQAVCPELKAITGDLCNLWFLRFLTSRQELPQLARMRRGSLLKIAGIGPRYADLIQAWQKQADFSHEVDWVGEMILADARRLLELLAQIKELKQKIEPIAEKSEIACRIRTIDGFGAVCSAELAGEIATLERFEKESSLALYLGMACLDDTSGKPRKRKKTKNPRHVNKRAKRAMMTGVAHNAWQVPQSGAYYDKKRAEGKSHNQAIRALGRHLVRVIWSLIKQGRGYEIREKSTGNS